TSRGSSPDRASWKGCMPSSRRSSASRLFSPRHTEPAFRECEWTFSLSSRCHQTRSFDDARVPSRYRQPLAFLQPMLKSKRYASSRRRSCRHGSPDPSTHRGRPRRRLRAHRNKQQGGGGELRMPPDLSNHYPLSEVEIAEWVRTRLAVEQQSIYGLYEELLAMGISPEVARVDTPVARYSRMRAKTDLRNWLAFLTLRSDEAAQWEIRQFAYALGYFISRLFPRTWDLWLNADRKKPQIDKNGFILTETSHKHPHGE